MKTLLVALAIGFCLSALGADALAAPASSSVSGTMSEEQWVMLVYQKGKENYDRGDYERAAAEWDKLSGMVDRYPAFKLVIDYLRGKTKSISPESADQVERQLAARKEKINAAFQKGKELYDQGKMSEALKAWDELALLLPEDAAQSRLIEDLRRHYIRSQETARTGGLTEEESAEMRKFFAGASELFKTQAEQAKAALEASDSAQKNIDEGFSKAKFLYYQGNYGDAMKEIEKLAPYFAENSSEREGAESVTRVYKQSLDEKSSAERALAQKSVKVELPPDFGKFSSEVNEKFRAELKESEARLTASRKTLEDRQAWSSADLRKGMELYRQGKVDEAIRRWESVAKDFENERAVQTLVQTAKKNQARLTRIRAEHAGALAQKQALLDGHLEKGRDLYEAGNFEQAKKEWNSLKGLVQDPGRIDAFLSQFQQVHQDSLKVKKAEEESKAAASARLPVPESLSGMLALAQEKLKSSIASARAQQAQTEAALAERAALVQKTVSNGKSLIDSGKFSDAFKEWATLLPVVEDEAGLGRALDALESDLEASQRAESQAIQAESKKDAKAALPEDLSALILEAGRQIGAQNDAAASRKKQAEQSVIDRQAFVLEHFEKGKFLFDSGKFSDAFKEWSSLLPYLENQEKLRPLIDQASQDQEALALVQRAANEAETRKDRKFSAPSGLMKLIEDARAKMASDLAASQARKESADKQSGRRQALIQNTFDRGKALYEEGKYSEAVKEWSVIVDELEEADKLRAAMKDIDTAYERSIEARKTADESVSRSEAKLPAPAGMAPLLTEVRQKIQAQTEAQQARRQKADEALAERRARLDATFAKGRLAMDEGKTDEALLEWDPLLSEFEEEERLRGMIGGVRAGQAALAENLQEAASAQARQAAKIAAPPELEKTLAGFLSKVKDETELAQAQRQRHEEEFEGRKTLARNTYLKGLALFDEGKFQEALAEWSNLLPDLEDRSRLQESIDKANKDFENLAIAQRAVFDADARRRQKLKAPEDLARHMKVAIDKIKLQSVDQFSEILDQEIRAANVDKESLALTTKKFKTPSDISTELADAREKLKERAARAEADKKAAVEALAERQARVQAEFDKGKKLYWEGKLADAVQIWAAIAPQLEDRELQKQIAALAQDYDNLPGIQSAAQEAELRRDDKLKTPEELPKLLGNMRQIVQSQTQYADTQKKIADQTYLDRQTLINSTFQKGKNLYEQDRIPEALEEWASIAPYLEKGSEIKEFIDGVARGYQESLTAKKAADESQLKKTIKFQTPPDLSRYLEEASERMKAQAEDSQMQKEAADWSKRERQIWVDGKFERGKLLYQQGDVGGAVDEWKAILPYIEDDSKVRQLILRAEENRKKLEDAVGADLVSAQGTTTRVAPTTPEKILIPPDLGRAIEAANLQLAKSVAKNEREKLEADVLGVIQDKKKKSRKETKPKPARAPAKVPLDEIEQMMLEYNVATPQELEKRHREMKGVQ